MNDIIAKIEELNDWAEVGSWFDVSKTARKIFLKKEILKKWVEFHLKENEFNFPNWGFKPIKLDESMRNILPEQIFNLQDKVLENLGDKFNNIIVDRFFITGGFVASCIFDTEYSDIDIWVNFSETIEYRIKIDYIDYVPISHFNLETTISEFDISSCQIGVLFENKKPVATYFTPLFLYTLFFRKVIIGLLPLGIDYMAGSFTYSLSLQEIYKLHLLHNKIGILKGTHWYSEEKYKEYCILSGTEEEIIEKRKFPFSNCLQCKSFMETRNTHNKKAHEENIFVIFKWFDRIEKYKNRFKNYNIEYIFSERTYNKEYLEEIEI